MTQSDLLSQQQQILRDASAAENGAVEVSGPLRPRGYSATHLRAALALQSMGFGVVGDGKGRWALAFTINEAGRAAL
jgi:hypothetical protein